MNKGRHKAIFFDDGKRWHRVKRILILCVVSCIGIVGLIIYAYVYSPFPARTSSEESKKIAEQVEIINNESRPVINQGTFMTLENAYGKTYVKRFGEEQKFVLLTFDDGPDPNITPKILDALQKNGVPGTFFIVGNQLYKYPDVAKSIVQRGSDVGLHTFSHYENVEDKQLNSQTFIKELDFPEKLFAHHFGYKTKLFRIPYVGLEDKLSYNSLQYVRESFDRRLVVSSPTVDASDWNVKSAHDVFTQSIRSDVQTVVILMHDAGGNRDATIKALPSIIDFYQKRGYKFITVSQLAEVYNLQTKEPLTRQDQFLIPVMYNSYNLVKQSPRILTEGFFIGFLLVLIHTCIFMIFAILEAMRSRKETHHRHTDHRIFNPLVTVIIPMHNEQHSIKGTVASVFKSSYRHLEVIVVDDGSSDNSLDELQTFKRDRRFKVFSKRNEGKWSALNYGLSRSKGKILVTIDADTRIRPSAIKRIVHTFLDKKVGAVAGVLRVGNRKNALSKLQSLEYIVNQGIEKRATSLFRQVMVVPGAFGAWRAAAIKKVGGFSHTTLAEDFDLTLSIIRKGYNVEFCSHAIAYTESPLSLKQWITQRFRWNFGNLQVYFKHRDMILKPRHKAAGMMFLPRAVFLQIPALFVTPLIDFFIITNLLVGERSLTLIFLMLYFVVNFITAFVAHILMNHRFEDAHLVPLLRMPYTQLLYTILVMTMTRALKGEFTVWTKLHHTGRLSTASS